MLYDKDAGHTHYLEDVYESHSRMPGGRWDPASVPWIDVVSKQLVPLDIKGCICHLTKWQIHPFIVFYLLYTPPPNL